MTKLPTDLVLTPRGFRVIAMHSDSAFGDIIREWMCDVQEAFALMAKANRDQAMQAFQETRTRLLETANTLAATTNQLSDAASNLTALQTRCKTEPMVPTADRMPAGDDLNFESNPVFKRLTRAFPYLAIDRLYFKSDGKGLRDASVYTNLIYDITGVLTIMPTERIGNITATTLLFRAMKLRMESWTGVRPVYCTDLTLRQMYTFIRNFCVHLESNNEDPSEMAVWLTDIEAAHPDIEPMCFDDDILDVGAELCDEPADGGAVPMPVYQLFRQCTLEEYPGLWHRAKRARV